MSENGQALFLNVRYNAGMAYHVPAGTPCKVARPGQTAQAYTTTADQVFSEDELIADRDNLPGDNPAAAYWAKRGYYVFRRQGSDVYLMGPPWSSAIVRNYDVLLDF